ncbi:MAG: hypothetical protein AB7G68_11200 [Nitrospiraceae bacterium]
MERRAITCQIFIEERDNGAIWVPYKTLIGYRLGNRVFIRSYGEQLYCDDEFASKDDAINRAKTNALDIVKVKFRNVDENDIHWDVREERAPVFAEV